VQEQTAADDRSEIPASCKTGSGQPPSDQMQELLTSAGERANAHNFSRTFSITLWFGAGILIVVFLGLFALPRRVRTRDVDAERASTAVARATQTAR
jgi:hypothetical protein